MAFQMPRGRGAVGADVGSILISRLGEPFGLLVGRLLVSWDFVVFDACRFRRPRELGIPLVPLARALSPGTCSRPSVPSAARGTPQVVLPSRDVAELVEHRSCAFCQRPTPDPICRPKPFIAELRFQSRPVPRLLRYRRSRRKRSVKESHLRLAQNTPMPAAMIASTAISRSDMRFVRLWIATSLTAVAGSPAEQE